jgi:hypothetical protein
MGLYKGESVQIEKIRTANGNAWITQSYVLKQHTAQVTSDISNYFGQNTVLPAELKHCLFTGKFEILKYTMFGCNLAHR